MSLGIAFKGPEGIVLAADSRVTLTATSDNSGHREITHSYYDNATKLLRVNGQDFVGAVTYGQGAIGGGSPRTAHSYLPEFEADLAGNGRLSVETFATKLSEFFQKQWDMSEMPAESTPMLFLVGGYDPDQPYGRVFQFSIPTAPDPDEVQKGPNDFGMVWGGQTEITDRIINGFDVRLPNIAQEILSLSDDDRDHLGRRLQESLQTVIPFQFLPLQDCVDISILLIRTTIAIQNWIVGVRGVGGPIDIATITRTDGFTSIQQKSITGERIELTTALNPMED